MPRGLLVLAALTILSAAALVFRSLGPQSLGFPACPFHQLTGLDCPGCGMTRATFAVLHGRFAEAFRLNPLGIILLPVIMTGAVLKVAGWVLGNPACSWLKTGPRTARAILLLLLVYWVVRNLPWWPFPTP